MNKEDLIDKVIQQIQYDLNMGDSTAIEELLKKVDNKYLEAYLPEIDECNKIIVYQDWTSDFIGKNISDGWYCIDNGDEVYLKDKFKVLPEITVTHYDQNTIKPNQGYFYLTDKVKETFI